MPRSWLLGCRLAPVFACCGSRPAHTDQACSNLDRCPNPICCLCSASRCPRPICCLCSASMYCALLLRQCRHAFPLPWTAPTLDWPCPGLAVPWTGPTLDWPCPSGLVRPLAAPEHHRYYMDGQHVPVAVPAKVGVLLVNLGTPDATDYWSMR